MKIYLDKDFRCRCTDDGTCQQIETDFFRGKCSAYIEGYRFVPSGQTWVREDGAVFVGEMAAPRIPYGTLKELQRDFEHEQLSVVTAERDALLDEMQALIDEILGGDADV